MQRTDKGNEIDIAFSRAFSGIIFM